MAAGSSAASAADRRRMRDHPHVVGARLGAVVAGLFATAFVLLTVLVVSEWSPLERLDRGVADRLHEVARGNAGLVDALRFGAVALDPWVFRAGVLAVALWLWRRGARRPAVWAVVTAVVGGVLVVVLKLVVARPRPVFADPVATSGGYSFPSGHATGSMLCVAVIVLVLWPVLGRRGRAVAYAVGAALVLLTGYDRIGLGVHYVSDVVAGWLVAVACVACVAAAFAVPRRGNDGPPL